MRTCNQLPQPCRPHLGLAGGTLALQRLHLNGEEWTAGEEAFFFFFALSGEAAWRCGSAVRRVVSGDVLMVKGPGPGALAAATDGGAALAWFSVAEQQLNPLFALGELCAWQAVEEALAQSRHYHSRSELARTCHRLISEIPDGPALARRVHLLRVVSTVLCAELQRPKRGLPQLQGAEERILSALGRLAINEILRLSADELSVKLNCSRRHLDRLFKRHFGLSAKGIKSELRLLRAAALLRNPHLKVINVADESGFNHLGRFNVSFRRRFGRSPSEWRASQAHSRAPDEAHSTVPCPLRAIGLCPWTEAKLSATSS